MVVARNYFDLPQPNGSLCHLLKYNRAKSFLELKVYEEEGDDAAYLQFEGVAYYEGPVFWKGANFLVASNADCIKVLRDLKIHDNVPDPQLAEMFQMYTARVYRTTRQVKIIALFAQRAQTPSP